MAEKEGWTFRCEWEEPDVSRLDVFGILEHFVVIRPSKTVI